jgi:hypothetical protein
LYPGNVIVLHELVVVVYSGSVVTVELLELIGQVLNADPGGGTYCSIVDRVRQLGVFAEERVKEDSKGNHLTDCPSRNSNAERSKYYEGYRRVSFF